MILSALIKNKFVAKLIQIFGPILLSKHDRQVLFWKQSKKDHLRLSYDLNSNSTVFDLGGYEGQWTSDIFSKYQCLVYIFEPVPLYAKKIKERFKLNSKIRIYNFGLSNANRFINLHLSEDGTSEFKNSGKVIKGKLIDYVEFIKKEKIKQIDLMKLNIEGGEYDLLEYIINSGWITNVKNLQIQFHSIVPNAKTRMQNIQSQLKKTHELTFQYEFLWENWKLRQAG